MGDKNYYKEAIERLGWQECTVWFVINNGIHHNHLEMGHAASEKPIGDSRQTKIWAGQKWSKRFDYVAGKSKPLRFVSK